MGKNVKEVKEEVSTVVLTAEQVQQYEAAKKHIASGFKKIEGGYLSIASDVAAIKQNESYTHDGYGSISAAMRGMFGMSKQTTSNLLAIAYRFGTKDTFEILPEYKKASMKALLAVAPLTHEEEAQLPVGWQFWTESDLKKKVKEIKGLPDKAGTGTKKSNKNKSVCDSGNEESEESTSGLSVFADVKIGREVWNNDKAFADMLRGVMRAFMEEGKINGSTFSFNITIKE